MNKGRPLRAAMFNRKASSPRSKPDLIVKTLAIEEGMCIADIGSGGGFFSFEFAKKVGDSGIVYSVDTNQDFLAFINSQAKERGIKTVRTVLVNGNDLNIPDKSVDLIFIRNAYHHLSNRVEYLKKLAKILSKNGKIALIDYNGTGFSFLNLIGHYVREDKIMEEMRSSGYQLVNSYKFLAKQSFFIFAKN